ncbi:MAG: redox-regulated ATPase YchF [Candidatus Bathyarchaeota archaeon]|nr:redox-regulated ATPase YchF [Candidatus Bathyarchaeota archaeon]
MLIGVVGKPNTGKSTFFSATTLIPVPIDSRPFTTIKSNRGIAYVRSQCVCKELAVDDQPKNSLCINGVRLIPVELIDCAGLVPDAWQGRGLGNYFLDEVRKADALIHVVDAAGATDEEGQLSEPGTHDPVKDVAFLEREITMWLVQILTKDWRRIGQAVETTRGDLVDALYDKLSGLAIQKAPILEAIRTTGLNPDKPTEWSDEDLTRFADELRQNSKPMMIAANKMDVSTVEENILHLQKLGYTVVPCSAEAELILRRAAQNGLIDYLPGDPNFQIKNEVKLTQGQRRALAFVRDRIFKKWGTTGVQGVLNTAFYELLKMITVYPVENVEKLCDHNDRVLPDAFLVPHGTTAKQFAYLIHSDLGEGFIYAINARTRRRLGEDYVLKDRDVVKIVSAKSRR